MYHKCFTSTNSFHQSVKMFYNWLIRPSQKSRKYKSLVKRIKIFRFWKKNALGAQVKLNYWSYVSRSTYHIRDASFFIFFCHIDGRLYFPEKHLCQRKKKKFNKGSCDTFCVLVNITVSLSISIKWSWNFIVWQVKFNRCLDPNESFQRMPCKTVGVRVVKNWSF